MVCTRVSCCIDPFRAVLVIYKQNYNNNIKEPSIAHRLLQADLLFNYNIVDIGQSSSYQVEGVNQRHHTALIFSHSKCSPLLHTSNYNASYFTLLSLQYTFDTRQKTCLRPSFAVQKVAIAIG